jgi:lysophospholipase L1-like esterase
MTGFTRTRGLWAALAFFALSCSSGSTSYDGADTSDPMETSDPVTDGVDEDTAGDPFADPVPDATPDGEPDALPDGADAVDVLQEEEPAWPPPIDDLDDLKLYVNIGDSLAAGYNADGRNGSGGKGYARLMLENHPDYPAYLGHSLRALYPDVQFMDISHSGDTSSDALDRVRDASWPSVDGDVLVSLTCGGNDFNDDITTMILRTATEAVAANLQSNYREIVGILRSHYDNPAAGHVVVFLVTNIHDPTGGTGAIPPGYSDGFCGLLNDPRVIPVRATAIANLLFFNSKIAEVTAELGGYLVDNHGVFFDHGMNAAGDARWIDDDCVHPLNEGHHQLRREEWFVLTSERW